MSKFDPYYQWLGIPPAQQPASHYRLLGITDFEPDPTVIENAADQRALLVRNMSNGPNAKIAQKLLNEVSAAKLVLIDPKCKADYDQTLRKSTQAAHPTPTASLEPVAIEEELGELAISDGTAHNASSVRARSGKRKSSTALYAAIGAGSVAVLVALFFVLGGIGGSGTETKPKASVASMSVQAISDHAAEVGTVFAVHAKVKIKGKLKAEPIFELEEGSPLGATIDSATGEIRWTPQRSDGGRVHTFGVRVAAGKLSITRRFKVTVAEVNDPPKFFQIKDRRVQAGTPVTVQLSAKDDRRGGAVTYRLVSELPGATLDKKTGAFSWRPRIADAGKQIKVKVAAIDEQGLETTKSFVIDVEQIAEITSVDLASTVDLDKEHAFGGEWSMLGEVVTVAGPSVARLVLDQTPRWSQYVLASTVQTNGRALAAGLLVDNRQVLAVLGATKETSGLRAKDGTLVGAVSNDGASPIASSDKIDVRYFVHARGVLVTCDGKPAIHWTGEWADLADPGPRWRVPESDKVFIGSEAGRSHWDRLRFERLEPDALTTALSKIGPDVTTISKMPDAAKITAARKLAEEAFGARIVADRTLEEHQETFDKIRTALGSEGVSAAERYVLTEMAIDVASRAGKTQTAIAMIDSMKKNFGIDPAPRYVATIKALTASRHTDGEEALAAIAGKAAELVERLIADRAFESAQDVLSIALQTARKARNSDVTKRVVGLKKDIDSLGKMHERVVAARERLKTEPDNAAANSVAGRWSAFVEGRWPAGLRELAKGDQAMLKAIATRDLAETTDAHTQYKLAVDWFKLGRLTSGHMQREITKRARYWYEIAEPRLSPLQKQAVPDEFKKAIAALVEETADESELAGPIEPVINSDDQIDAATALSDPPKVSLARGRYVRVRLEGPARILSLAEVQVYETRTGRALHLSGRATQSSTDPMWSAVAGRAIDGNTKQLWKHGTITQTNEEANPWWVVDLGSSKDIGRVRILNRAELLGERLNGAILEVLDARGKKVSYAARLSRVDHGSVHVFEKRPVGTLRKKPPSREPRSR